ncbi:MAG TPA: hypothetical protein VK653_10245 [Xanthobacteraceae bacterium]|nr:hypothetical protein [Xanthobacteraceae bacterium]
MKSASRRQPPVFVHASPRSGSTYFFNVLRRNTSLMCFNEALMDGKNDVCRSAKSGERRSPSANKATSWNVNHHFLDRPDDEEFIEAWDAVMHLFPAAPAFRDYLPADGVLNSDVKAYFFGLNHYANAQNKRAAFCEINSRGRAGALRGAFGGFHATQIRDPISQFGSFYRPLEEAGEWGFLLHPLKELGINGHHPLYEIVPEEWRPPVLPWPAADYTRRWASEVEYVLLLADVRPETLENAFRWHMFAWLLSNLAAAVYSDFVLDIDRAHDDAVYRTEVTKVFASETGMDADFSDITKFSRYYQFEPFDAAAVASQVVSAVNDALADGRMEKALSLLARSSVKIPARESAQLLFAKIENSVASFGTSSNRRLVSNEDWAQLVTKHTMPWSLARNRTLRETARVVYPFLAPVVRAVRRILQKGIAIHSLDRRISDKG